MPSIDERVTNLLHFVQKLARRNQDIVYGDGAEGTRDSPEARNFCRKLAAEGMVLLKNEGAVLPLSPTKFRKLAIIGPNARARVISGGGSAALKASYVVTPWEGLRAGAPETVELSYELGTYGEPQNISTRRGTDSLSAHRYLPTLENNLRAPNGENGWLCTFYCHDDEGAPSKAVADYVLNDTRVKLNDFLPPGLTSTWTLKLAGKLQFDKTGTYELGLTVAGRSGTFRGSIFC